MSTQTISQYKKLKNYSEKVNAFIDLYYTSRTLTSTEVYNSNAIEGNTLSLSDTQELLSREINPEKLTLIHTRKHIEETYNLREAIEYINKNYRRTIIEDDITNIHYILLRNCMDPTKVGVYRLLPAWTNVKQTDTTIKKHYYVDDKEVPREMELLIRQGTQLALRDIILFKLDFVRIHPFSDGNGRTSRLLLNWLLAYNGYPPITIPVDRREEYITAVARYTSDANPVPFINFVTELLLIQLSEIFD